MTNWWNSLFAVAAVCVCLYFVVSGVARGPAGRLACWTHALMAGAMAGMFWPWGDPLPAPVGAVGFAALGAWFLAVRLRGGRGAPHEPVHVAVGCAAMVVMYAGVAQADHGGGHAAHAAAAASGSIGLLAVAVGLLLTGYFAWHAWETAATRPGGRAPSGRGGTAVLASPRVETAAHLVLDGSMAVMFLGAL